MDLIRMFVYLSVFIVSTFAEECQKQSTCSCKTSKGTIDLHKLVDNKINPRFSLPDSLTYKWEPCYAMGNGICNGEGVAVCLVGTSTFVLGYQTQVSFSGDPSDNNLQIKYTGNADQSATVNLVCNENQEGDFRLMSSNYPNYYFELQSKYACLPTPAGISAGTVLLIVFVILLLIYFVAGMMYMKFVRGASGTEMIPNKGFWTSLPGLIKDGVLFVCRGCKGTSTYSQI